MPRKQASVNESSAAAARAAQPKAPRVKSAKHTKAASPESAAAPETNPAIDSAAVTNVLQAELPVEQIETSIFVSASAGNGSATPANGDPTEEIARIAYSYWQARGCMGGDPIEDWVRAENEYRSRLG